MEPSQERSLILRHSHELATLRAGRSRILGDMVETSLALAKEAKPAAVDLDALQVEQQLGSTRKFEVFAPYFFAIPDRNVIPIDYDEAMSWYRKTTKQDDVASLEEMGASYWKGNGTLQNVHEAFKWFEEAAERGDAYAQRIVGCYYYNGERVTQNYAEAVRWLRLAAEQGDASAESILGTCYDYGRGIPPDPDEAARWYRMAAEQGDSHAQYCIGGCHQSGFFGDPDLRQACAWHQLAEDNGCERAAGVAKRLAKYLSPEELFEARALYSEFKAKYSRKR